MADFPIDTPTEFTVKKVEVKKMLPPKNEGEQPAVVMKLGLLAPNGAKGWPVEMWCPSATQAPKENQRVTLVVTKPDNPNWALKATPPRKGGGKPGGGRSPANDASIEAQVALKAAIEYAASVHNGNPVSVVDIHNFTVAFAKAIREAKAA